MRVDAWLWVVRLTKTRAAAADAATGGRVQVNGRPAKPAREVGPGDRVELATGPVRRQVVVRGTAPRRLPAAEAVRLYDETPESLAARERDAQERRLAAAPPPVRGAGRPTKRDRRRLDRFRG